LGEELYGWRLDEVSWGKKPRVSNGTIVMAAKGIKRPTIFAMPVKKCQEKICSCKYVQDGAKVGMGYIGKHVKHVPPSPHTHTHADRQKPMAQGSGVHV
jgi:hypothetical protein